MAKAKQVLDVRVSKGITTSQSNEHQRRWTEKGWEQALEKGNYDPSREHLNFEIVSGKVRPVDKSRSIPERMAEILDRRGIKDPNEGLDEPKYRTVVNIIFGGSRDRMRELAFGSQKVNFDKGADNSDVERKRDIERWAKDVYAFVSGRYGEQNIAAFIVHLDEINPHVHCTLLPIKDGRFAYKEIFAGKDKYEFSQRMKQLHTDFSPKSIRSGGCRGDGAFPKRAPGISRPRSTAVCFRRSVRPLRRISIAIERCFSPSSRTSGWQSAGSRDLPRWSITSKSRRLKSRRSYRQPNAIWQPTATMRRSWRC